VDPSARLRAGAGALEACLKKDPHYLAALADLAMVRYRAMDYQGAWDLTRRGLAIDTYDPASNYYYGLASVRLAAASTRSTGLKSLLRRRRSGPRR